MNKRLFIFVMVISLMLMACGKVHEPPRAKGGVLDLSHWRFDTDGIINLNGEWEFYWGQLLEPKDFEGGRPHKITGFFNIPGSWNGYEAKGQRLSGDGFATFRLKVKLRDPRKIYALKLLDTATAYRLWMNGDILASNGLVGNNKSTMVPKYLPQISFFSPDSAEFQILLQVSNFFHKKGGVWEPIVLGTEGQIIKKRERKLYLDLFLSGSLLMMALYHFGLYSLRRKDPSALYFGIFCLNIALYPMMVGERFFISIFPDIDWEITQKIEFLNSYLFVPILAMFIAKLYPNEFSQKVLRFAQLFGLLFALIILFTPVKIYSHTVLPYNSVSLLIGLYLFYVVFMAIVRKREGAKLFFFGGVPFYVTATNDVLNMAEILYTGLFMPIGLFILVCCQSLVLSMRFSKAFSRVETLSESLAISEEKYRDIFENAVEGIFQITPEARFISCNKATSEIIGHTSSTTLPFVHGEDRHTFLDLLRKEDQVIGFKTQIYGQDGRAIWISMNARAVRDANNHILHYEGSMLDITEAKEKEKAQRERDAAEAANKAKSEFLASMSHEIRTPMNAVLGMAELLSESHLSPEQKKYVRILCNSGENLLDLINDILDFSKIEAGQISLENVLFDLRELVEKSCEIMALKAHEKNLELLCHIWPGTPETIVGDPVRLRQILINLLGNAVKFTQEGEIVVEVKNRTGTSEAPAGRGELLFSVRDTGIGVPGEKQSVIFESFSQADASTTRQYGGTGLGLTICKLFVKMMGGKIWVESESGKGSTFSFTVVTGIDREHKLIKDQTSLDFRGLRVLIVDDSTINRLILRETLASWGAIVIEAEDGKTCLETIESNEETGDPFGLILLDGKMPGMDGFEVAEQIKTRFGHLSQIAMLLTSDDTDGNFKRATDLGISTSLVKPVKRQELKEAIALTLGKAFAATESVEIDEKAVKAPDEQSLRILLVEDNEDNQVLFTSFLKRTPHRIDIAENGRIGVEKVISGTYDLVFMDMEMPVMDGYEATRRIREWESEKGVEPIPIIALTAHALKGKEQESLAAGCTTHMTKPIKKRTLIDAIGIYAPVGFSDERGKGRKG